MGTPKDRCCRDAEGATYCLDHVLDGEVCTPKPQPLESDAQGQRQSHELGGDAVRYDRPGEYGEAHNLPEEEEQTRSRRTDLVHHNRCHPRAPELGEDRSHSKHGDLHRGKPEAKEIADNLTAKVKNSEIENTT